MRVPGLELAQVLALVPVPGLELAPVLVLVPGLVLVLHKQLQCC